MNTRISKTAAVVTVVGSFMFGAFLLTLSGRSNIKNPFPMDAGSIQRGRGIFTNYCSGCHGKRADGRGPQALNLDPKPQNLRNAQFIKHLSDERIFSSISGGVRGTSMQAFELMLGENMRWDVINFIRSLSADDKINVKNSLVSIQVPADKKNPVKPDAAVLARGKKDYLYHCSGCHGLKADGAGETAVNLRPAPRNLIAVKSWGEKPFIDYLGDSRLFDSIANGVSGTSMAPWGGVLKENDLWGVIVYLKNQASVELKRIEASGGK